MRYSEQAVVLPRARMSFVRRISPVLAPVPPIGTQLSHRLYGDNNAGIDVDVIVGAGLEVKSSIS